jgi:hypothetical protein
MKQKLQFDNLDVFARPLPTLNIDGMQKVSSCVGLVFSVLLFTFVIGIATSRLTILFGTGNPIISSYEIESEYELHNKVNLHEFGFAVAFKVERINKDESRTTVHDADLVDYAVVIDETDENGVNTPTEAGYHKCNTDDYG